MVLMDEIDKKIEEMVKEEQKVVKKKVQDFVQDMRALGQEEVVTVGPGYELFLKITSRPI